MQFKFPKDDTTIMRRPVPNRYRGYFIAHRPVELIRSPKGELLVQRVSNTHFLLQFQALSCAQPYPVVPHIAGTRIVLFYMLEGNFACPAGKGGPVEVRAGNYCRFVFMPEAGASIPTITLSRGHYVSVHVEFTQAFYQAAAREAPDRSHSTSGHTFPIGPGIHSVLHAICHCPEKEPDQLVFLDIQVRRLMFYYLHYRRSPGFSTGYLMEDITQFIQQHIDATLSVEMLAGQFHVSKSTLERYFEQYHGMPVFRYIFQQRMALALALLRSGESVGAVALETGFKELSSFTHAFTRYFGKAPSYFRKPSP